MKKFLDFLRAGKPRQSAKVAKERLQIIVSHETAKTDDPDFIDRLQNELLTVICKYVDINPEQIRVQLEKRGDQSVLELNVTLSPELAEAADAAATSTSA